MTRNLATSLNALKIESNQRLNDSSRMRWLPIPLLGGAAMLGVWFIAKEEGAPRARVQESVAAAQAATTTIVELSASGSAAGGGSFTATGYVEAQESSRVAPKVAGRVARVHVRQGDVVKREQLLLELDPADEEASLKVAQQRESTATAERRRAMAKLAVLKADLEALGLQAKRERLLSKAGVSASGAAEDLDARVKALGRAVRAGRAEVAASRARVRESAALVEARRTALRNLSLSAPFDGIIVNEPPDVGEFVGPQPAGIAVDMGGIQVANLSTLIVKVDVPELRYRRLVVGAPCEIVLDAFGEESFAGRVDVVTPEVNRAKATIRVKVAFLKPARGVLPNLAARVTFPSSSSNPEYRGHKGSKRVAATAVVQRDGRFFVFEVVDGRLVRHAVELGERQGDSVELRQGPPGGRVILLHPTEDSKAGDSL